MTATTDEKASTSGLRVAALVSVFRPNSHADVILSRWNRPWPGDRELGWRGSRFRLASMHCDQVPADDRSVEFCRREGVVRCSSVEEALTLGSGTIRVDAVMIVYEHGEYPRDERGAKRYPRREVFEQLVLLFEEHGRKVPVFLDKHPSWNAADARAMVELAEARGIPLFAGSCLPWPPIDPAPPRSVLEAATTAVSVFNCGLEDYGIHSVEAALALLENRRGGESGISGIQVFNGVEAWRALRSGLVDRKLLELAVEAGGEEFGGWEQRQKEDPVVFLLEHADGLKNQFVAQRCRSEEFSIAVGSPAGKCWSGRWVLGGPENHFNHFAALNVQIERHFLGRNPPGTLHRSLLASVAMAAVLDEFSGSTEGRGLEVLRAMGRR